MTSSRVGKRKTRAFDDPRGVTPNAGAHLLPEAGATQERTLEAVRFRVKAPVPRRPPHRSGRDGCPHPVPREPAASATGSPHRRHPVWRITVLSLARRDVVHDPGLRERQFFLEGRDTLLPASVARVAASAQPIAPRPLGMRADHFAPLDIAPDTILLVIATQLRTSRPILLLHWCMAVFTTPCPYCFHTPAQAFPARLPLDGPVSPACLGPIVGKSQQVDTTRPPADGSRRGGFLHASNPVFSGGIVRRKRLHRFGKTAIPRRASAANAQPMMQSSAQRVRKPRPCLRGCTSWTTHASST